MRVYLTVPLSHTCHSMQAKQAQDQGSINLTNEQLIANDDGTEVRPQEELLIASLYGS